MKKIFIIVLLCIIGTMVNAEIRQILDNFPQITGRHQNWDRSIIGKFEFENLPEPMKVATIHYKLEVVNVIYNSDWDIALSSSKRFVHVLSDLKQVWSAPHKVGDIYTGTIECIPLASGVHGVTLSVQNNEFKINWIFDEDGNLIVLDNVHIAESYPSLLRTFFFNNDKLHLKIEYPSKGKPFNHEITIDPLPKIGAKSTVNIRLTSNTNFAQGLDFELSSKHVNIVSFPEIIDYSIIENQVVDLSFDIIPEKFNLFHGITLGVYNDISKPLDSIRQDFMLSFVFKEDGSLRYFIDRGFNLKKIRKYKLHGYEDPVDFGFRSVKILKSGKVVNHDFAK